MKNPDLHSIIDRNGRSYAYVPTEIHNRFGIKSGSWNSQNCVLLVLRKDGEVYELINIVAIKGDFEVRNHFRAWNTLDEDNRSIHIDNQLGATHYAVINVQHEMLVSSTLNAIALANESKMARLRREDREEERKD